MPLLLLVPEIHRSVPLVLTVRPSTRLFAITFAAAMPVAQVAKFTGEQDTRIWRVLDHYVKRERAKLDFSGVEKVGVDETAAARLMHGITAQYLTTDTYRVRPGRPCASTRPPAAWG